MYKIALFVLFVIPVLAYGQTEQTPLYDNVVSNQELSLSIDKFEYWPDETVEIVGYVNDYRPGVRVFFSLLDSSGNVVDKNDSAPTQSGLFKIQYLLDIESGTYNFTANYGQKGSRVSIPLNVLSDNGAVIEIPRGASLEDSGVSFEPVLFSAQANQVIKWTNYDSTVHRIVDGKYRGANNGKSFDSGIISPNKSFEITLKEGSYDYFCMIHPWLVGSVSVLASAFEDVEESEQELLDILSIDKEAQLWSKSDCAGCANDVTMTKNEHHKAVLLTAKAEQYANGSKTVFRLNFAPISLSDYDFLSMWIKTGGNTNLESQIGVIDTNDKVRLLRLFGAQTFNAWSEMRLPLANLVYEDAEFNSSSVNGLVVFTPDATQMRSRQISVYLDDIRFEKVTTPKVEEQRLFDVNIVSEPIMSVNGVHYYVDGNKVIIKGSVYRAESGQPITATIYSPQGNLVSVEQVMPDDTSYNFTIPISGSLFKEGGEYRIDAQYGIKQYSDSVSFFVLKPSMVDSYKGLGVYAVGNKFYAIPLAEGTLDMERLGEFSLVFEGVSSDEIKSKIDGGPFVAPYLVEQYNGYDIVYYVGKYFAVQPGPVSSIERVINNDGIAFEAGSVEEIKIQIDMPPPPPPPFPVPDEVLLQIWNERADLQETFAEVSSGDLSALKDWATTSGWNEDERLAVLIPEGQTPAYLNVAPPPPFPVPDEVLLQIWNERADLQETFAEVSSGDLSALKDWASAIGWNQDKRLAALIPEGQTPDYLKEEKPEADLVPIMLVIILVNAVAAAVIVKFLKSKKKIKAQ